ncbi:serine hydrolase [Kangiella sp. TOML190]|uniref:serine hydrolase domain-containing protein n=1 Tax=Kangiella sp. TOML190 TaxID=2931351 RepID=UPI00203D5DEF|nr:serine hydrolase [Kangiella sp. TOML190]
MKKTIIILFLAPLLFILGLLVSGHGYILTAISRTYLVGNSTANINDHQQFETRLIKAGQTQAWATSRDFPKALPPELTSYLEKHNAIAFLVLHKGQLLSEQYFKGYDQTNKTNSFSMAKTLVTLLLGEAIEEGYIENLQQPITDFLPEFNKDPNGKLVSIGSLSTMTSGYEWDEHYYSPFSPTVELFYGDDVESFLLAGHFSSKPEETFYYSSASTQLLGIILDRALKQKNPEMTLSRYLSEKFWQPLGMNADALWHLDAQGMELAYCCVNTNARNFAKFGQLMLQNGRWQGQQLIVPFFVQMMSQPYKVDSYGYSTWINQNHSPKYHAFRGHLGQRIIIVPEQELVIVRLGESRGDDIVGAESLYIKQALSLLE